jgi:hypothetical protein
MFPVLSKISCFGKFSVNTSDFLRNWYQTPKPATSINIKIKRAQGTKEEFWRICLSLKAV